MMAFHSDSFKRSMKTQRGFAYLWTLLMIAFMGVGLVLASEIYSTTLQREKEKELLFIGRQFRDAIGRYYLTKLGGPQQYPLTLDELLKDSRSLSPMRHLRRVYRDPMTGKEEWQLILLNGRIVGVRSFSNKMPIKQDNFEVTEGSLIGKSKYSDWAFTYPPDLLANVTQKGDNASGNPDKVNGVISSAPSQPGKLDGVSGK